MTPNFGGKMATNLRIGKYGRLAHYRTRIVWYILNCVMWPEVDIVKKEKRCELILNGDSISKRILTESLDNDIFSLTNLNYLSISNTCLDCVPDAISKLINLQSLVLHSNQIDQLNTKGIKSLRFLKTLDLSNNQLTYLSSEIGDLPKLEVLNLSKNAIVELPCFRKCTNLGILILTSNKLEKFPDVCYSDLSRLSEIIADQNVIAAIPNEIAALSSSLKVLNLHNNKITDVPKGVANLAKLKEFQIDQNPLVDKRLQKVVEKNQVKLILDFLKKKYKEVISTNPIQNLSVPDTDENHKDKFTIQIYPYNSKVVVRVYTELVKNIRPHILCCIFENVNWTKESLRKFIQMQTRLHNDPLLCDKRISATIATHDFQKIIPSKSESTILKYMTRIPQILHIVPLGRTTEFSGSELYSKLKAEADQFRKEKKRSTISGVHKYLHLLRGVQAFPCLLGDNDVVISLPPITNSESTKITADTKNVFVEVTSSESLQKCRDVIEALVFETIKILDTTIDYGDATAHENLLEIRQVRIADCQDKLKAIYPSKSDLNLDQSDKYLVLREQRSD